MQFNQSTQNRIQSHRYMDSNFVAEDIHQQLQQNIQKFIQKFTKKNKKIYNEQVEDIKTNEVNYFNLDIEDLKQYDKDMFSMMMLASNDFIQIFENVINQMIKLPFHIFLVVNNMQPVKMSEIGPGFNGNMICIKALVIKISKPIPEMIYANFSCSICNQNFDVSLESNKIKEPSFCDYCKNKNSFVLNHNRSIFTDKQYIKVQELPEDVKPGCSPRTMNLISFDKFVDQVREGDKINIIGIFKTYPVQQQSTIKVYNSVYNSYIQVINYENNNKDLQQDQLTNNDMKEIKKLSQTQDLYQFLANNISPNIYEHEDVKKGLLLQLFGGTETKTRSELNVLLCGDPSVAKSQLIQFIHKLAPRGIYTSGKGSSKVGLTAYIHKDEHTGDITLESGALVLSDKGICCIDEFDKMSDATKTILHEAMESQTISIAKQGIIAQLNCRTAILAAANPKYSQYNIKQSIIENINLESSLISRFDLIYVLLDQVNEKKDEQLAFHILDMYTGKSKKKELDLNIFKKYVKYARENIKPQLTQQVMNYLINQYVEMRGQGQGKNVITSTPRQLESLIRLSEASAKLRLSDQVTIADCEEAFRLINVAIKQSATDPITGIIDLDVLQSGISNVQRKLYVKLADCLISVINQNSHMFRQPKDFDSVKQIVKRQFEDSFNDLDLIQAMNILQEDNKIILYGTNKKPRIKKIL